MKTHIMKNPIYILVFFFFLTLHLNGQVPKKVKVQNPNKKIELKNISNNEIKPVIQRPNVSMAPIQCSEIVNPQIERAVKEQMIMQNLPGLAVGVFKNGRLIHLKGYGYTNVVDKKKLDTKSILHWASISKAVTATAAVQLHQDSSIDYDISDLVTKHCSYWPSQLDYCDLYPGLCDRNSNIIDRRMGKITIAHLLQNRSGIQHYGRGRNGSTTPYTPIGSSLRFLRDTNYTADRDEYNAQSAVGVFSNSVIDFEPGSSFLYTTYGFNLAGATIEEASPNGYVDWVLKNIAQPAGMDSFQVANEVDREGHDMPSDGVLKILDSGNKESVLPGGGWESNICDFSKFAIGLAKGQFYDQSKDSLWINNSRTYKYGVNGTGSGSDFRVYHGGKHRNLRTYMHFFPSDETGIVLMSPVEYSGLPLLARHVYKAIDERLNLYGSNIQTPLDECRVDMKSGNDLFNAVWRKTNKDVIIRTGRPDSEFYEEVKRLQAEGYHCKDIEPFLHEGKLYWDGVFQKGFGPTRIWRNAGKSAFVDKCREMVQQGYRLYDVETYLNEDNKRLWAGVFRKTNDGYSVRLDRTTAEFAEVREREHANGKKLIDVEVYRKNNTLQWSGVFTKGSPNLLNRNYKVDDFSDLVARRQDAGYKLIDVEHYIVRSNGSSEYRVAGIWEKDTKTEKRRSFNDFCEVMKFHESFSGSGYELIDWNRIAKSD